MCNVLSNCNGSCGALRHGDARSRGYIGNEQQRDCAIARPWWEPLKDTAVMVFACNNASARDPMETYRLISNAIANDADGLAEFKRLMCDTATLFVELYAKTNATGATSQ